MQRTVWAMRLPLGDDALGEVFLKRLDLHEPHPHSLFLIPCRPTHSH